MPTAKPKAIDPDGLYRITFSAAFTGPSGERYIPREGVSVKVRGTVLEGIKDHLDHYEAV